MKTILGVVILIIIVLLVRGVSEKKNTNTGEVIKIGAVLSLTGSGVQDATTVREGIDLAISDLKEKGKNVEVIYSDDATDPKKTVSSVQFLKAQNVKGIVGFTWDFLYNAGAPALEQAGIVGITPTNSSEYSSKGAYSFTMAPKTALSNKILVKFLKENNIKRIAFLGTKFAWSDVHFANLKAAAAESGTEIISEEWMNFGSEIDVINTVIPKIKSTNPDALFLIAGGDQSLSLLFQRIQQHELKVPIIAGTTTIGRFIKDNSSILASEYPVYSLVPMGSEKFNQYFNSKTGKNPGEYTEYAYDSTIIMVESIEKSQQKNVTILDYMKNNSFKGYGQQYSFDENHDSIGGMWQIRKDN